MEMEFNALLIGKYPVVTCLPVNLVSCARTFESSALVMLDQGCYSITAMLIKMGCVPIGNSSHSAPEMSYRRSQKICIFNCRYVKLQEKTDKIAVCREMHTG